MQDVQDTCRRVCLSSIRVCWSESDAAFVAHSEQFPGLRCVDQFSSLAAMAGLLDAVEVGRAP